MHAAPDRPDESATLTALRDLAVLDTAPEAEFDALVRVASIACGAPIALISLIDERRQWFKAQVGLDGVSETPREFAFCGHTVLGDGVFEIADATRDDRFADNPLVTGPPHIRHYAGAPIRLSDGLCVGALCIVDPTPGQLDDAQRQALAGLAIAAARALEGRHATHVAFQGAMVSALTPQERAAASVHVRQVVAEFGRQHGVLQVALGSISDAVIATDGADRVDWLNAAAERLTGWTLGAACGLPVDQIFRTVEPPSAAADLPVPEPAPAARRALLIDRSGGEVPIELDPPAAAGSGRVLVFRDVSEADLASIESRRRLTRDALTGLVNRAEFERCLADAVRSARDGVAEHALLHIDLDKFRLINDGCGHRIGDLLLKAVAALLAGMVRASDTLARVGGDEFAVIMACCNVQQAEQAAQRICDRLEAFRFTGEGLRLRVGASIGLVALVRGCGDLSAVLQAAENSCRTAGEDGGSRVQLWSATERGLQARHGEMQWATRIELALDDDRFVLFAQRIEPLTAAAGGLHAEVLLRMVDIDGGLIPPGMFLPAAERFQLATRIDRWVLQHAIAWLQAQPKPERFGKLSVNLSGQSIGDRAFHGWALARLAAAGDALCRRLCFEITETAAVAHMEEAACFVARLHAIGVRVALDDFGAGASSFGYLKRLPVDYLKIDGQFIRELLTDRLNDAAVRCFVDVARVVGVRTVAEFVDQGAVLERLRQLGVDFAQGYLLHRPEPIDALLGAPAPPGPLAARMALRPALV